MEKLKKKYRPGKQPCRQDAGMEDCVCRNKAGNCNALTEPYPCGECPFYKPRRVFSEECMVTYERLTVLHRVDLIEKYGLRDSGLTGCWMESGHRRA